MSGMGFILSWGRGDVDDPRGGVRGVIPEMQKLLKNGGTFLCHIFGKRWYHFGISLFCAVSYLSEK